MDGKEPEVIFEGGKKEKPKQDGWRIRVTENDDIISPDVFARAQAKLKKRPLLDEGKEE